MTATHTRTNADTSEAGVTSTERQIELNGDRVRIGRLEHADWDGPHLSFNMDEPIAEGLEHSQIRVFNKFFKEKCPGYRLVDYGPLDGRALEREERE